jgi:rhomboid protease GluP
MAFGFPASYETEIEVTGSGQVVRDSIVRSLELLCWEFSVDESRSFFVARVPGGFASWGESLVVSLVDEPVIRITSTCRLWQMFDWGKNRKNVDRFIELLLGTVSYFAAMSGPPPVYLDESGKTPVRACDQR